MRIRFLIVVLLGMLMASGQAFAFLFGAAPAATGTTGLELSGKTIWSETGAADVTLTAAFSNSVSDEFQGEFRLIVMVMNGAMDFERVHISKVGDDGDKATGFLSDRLQLAGKATASRQYRIQLPDGSRGKIVQVMAVIFATAAADAPPPVVARAVYPLPQ
ncbi:MAG: hypothetical protein Q8O25_05570 [Sulfurisoma sp.]|nr:hypothetical protein [Sulfurisoma sp.]